jgi:hypothetical protein
VTNEEFHSDAVTESIVPPIPVVGRRDFFIFADNGKTLDRYAVVRYSEERLKNHYTVLNPARDKTAETIKKIIDEKNPKTIALNMGGGRGQSDGITFDAYKFPRREFGKRLRIALCFGRKIDCRLSRHAPAGRTRTLPNGGSCN